MAEDSNYETHSADRRPAARRRVLLPGLIVYAHGAFTCDCTIRNLSASGARIYANQHLQFPNRFYVINIRDGLAYDARVVWSNGAGVGIKFEATVTLSSNPDAAPGYLRRLWLAKVPR